MAIALIDDSAFAHVREIDGFPVSTKEFEDGKVTDETTLKSVEERSLDPAVFEPPAGYRKQAMGMPGRFRFVQDPGREGAVVRDRWETYLTGTVSGTKTTLPESKTPN